MWLKLLSALASCCLLSCAADYQARPAFLCSNGLNHSVGFAGNIFQEKLWDQNGPTVTREGTAEWADAGSIKVTVTKLSYYGGQFYSLDSPISLVANVAPDKSVVAFKDGSVLVCVPPTK